MTVDLDVLEEEARASWAEELQLQRGRLQENAKRDLAQLRRRLAVLGLAPDALPVEYPHEGGVRIRLWGPRNAQVRPGNPNDVIPTRPAVWACAHAGRFTLRASQLVDEGNRCGPPGDAGELGTLADLGRAIEEGGRPAAADTEEGTVELLAKVLRALVDDAVDARLAGEL